jgi:hypothetical protein
LFYNTISEAIVVLPTMPVDDDTARCLTQRGVEKSLRRLLRDLGGGPNGINPYFLLKKILTKNRSKKSPSRR